MLCTVCNKIESKYKCANCYSPYCCVDCWKVHKNLEKCQKVEKTKPNLALDKSLETKYFTDDTVNHEKLVKLSKSETLRNILKNKYLRATLTAVENASNPEKTLFEAMKDPDFINFVDESLRLVEDFDKE